MNQIYMTERLKYSVKSMGFELTKNLIYHKFESFSLDCIWLALIACHLAYSKFIGYQYSFVI